MMASQGREQMSRYGRWVGSISKAEPRGKVQIDTMLKNVLRDRMAPTLPEGVLRLAHAEYEHQYGHDQPYERMQERGGLSVFEVIGLLADYVERLGGKPTPAGHKHKTEYGERWCDRPCPVEQPDGGSSFGPADNASHGQA